MDNMETLTSGEILQQRYVIDECIKSDSRGAVYKAHDKSLNKMCCIKELFNFHKTLREKRDAKREFEKEAKIIYEVRHKKLPKILEYFGTDERSYIVMEYIYGYDLNNAFIKEGTFSFPPDRVITWMLEVCDLLDYLHNHYDKFIFRDLKPSNIMINELDGSIKLVDFGLAHNLKTDNTIKLETRGYNAPELEEGQIDVRSDVYSLGATMYYLLTGVVPVPPHIKPLKDLNPDISKILNNIIMKALSISPEDRQQNIREIYNELLMCGAKLKGGSAQKDAIDTFIGQLNQSDVELRKSAIKSLAEIDDDNILGPLINKLKEENESNVRKEIVIALKNFREDKDIVIKAICDAFKVEENPDVKASMTEVLGEFKARESIDILMGALQDQFADVQLGAIAGLGNIGDKKALNPLFDLYKNKNFIFRDDVRAAIEKIDSKFLNLWEEAEESQKISTLQKKNLLIGISIFIVLTIVIVSMKFIPPYIRENKIKANLIKGKEYFDKEDSKNAYDRFKEIIKLNERDPRGHYWVGMACTKMDKYVEALKAMEEAVKYDGKNPDYRIGLGKALINREMYDRAIGELEKVINVKKDSGEAYLYLGEACLRSGKKEKAKEYFNICINNFPKSSVALEANKYITLMNAPDNTATTAMPAGSSKMEEANDYLFNKENYDKAIQKFDEILAENPGDIEAHFGRGMAYYKKDDLNTAKEEFNRVLQTNYSHPGACISIAGIYLKENDLQKAIELAERGLSSNPGVYVGYYIRGIAYVKTGKNAEGLADFKKYVENAPDDQTSEQVKQWIKELEGNR
ncbi:MAG: tetratricopeptide repeat protein [Candidatus Eremiobacterota bacterium]